MREETFTEVLVGVRPAAERSLKVEQKGETLTARVSLSDRVWRLLVLGALASPFARPWVEAAMVVWEKLR